MKTLSETESPTTSHFFSSLLGHVSAAATRIYAKVDIKGLREVSSFSLSGLDTFVQRCEQAETPFYNAGDLVALRKVAGVSLEGLL